MLYLLHVYNITKYMNSTIKQIEFLMYNTPENNINIEAVVKDETLRLTQKSMSMLFDVNTQAITKHLKNIFSQ